MPASTCNPGEFYSSVNVTITCAGKIILHMTAMLVNDYMAASISCYLS